MANQDTRMQALRDWFGSSQLLDRNGEPLVLYHGTTGDFKSFRPSLSHGEWGAGSYFTTDKELASRQASSPEGGNVMPVYVKIENPVPAKVLEGVLAKYQKNGDDWDPQDVSDEIEGMGYDGVILQQGDQITAIAYDPTQIKSALGNHGVYDRLSPDIRFSLADEPFQAATPDSVRAAIAQLVRVSADELAEGVGTIVVATSEGLQAAGQAEEPAQRDEAFQAWFGGSKVVGADRKPLVVYHGTKSEFTSFEIGRSTKNYGFGEYETRREGVFFTPDMKFADEFTGKGGKIVTAYLSIQKPLDLSDGYPNDFYMKHRDMLSSNNLSRMQPEEMWEMLDDGFPGSEDFIAAVKSDGYDGLKMTERGSDGEAHVVYVALRPEQIKSADNNRGTYDPRDPDIRHSLAAGAAGLDPRAQAFHDVATNTTVFLADRIPAGKEASVFLHETVHRHGRQALPEGRWAALVDQVKVWAHSGLQTPERVIHDAAAARVATAGVAGAVADEELFAYAVEEAVAMGIEPTAAAVQGSAEAWLQVVVESIQRVTDKLLGNDLQELGGQDLVDLAYALAQLDSPEHGYAVRRALQEAPQAPTQGMANRQSRDFDEGPMP